MPLSPEHSGIMTCCLLCAGWPPNFASAPTLSLAHTRTWNETEFSAQSPEEAVTSTTKARDCSVQKNCAASSRWQPSSQSKQNSLCWHAKICSNCSKILTTNSKKRNNRRTNHRALDYTQNRWQQSIASPETLQAIGTGRPPCNQAAPDSRQASAQRGRKPP